MSPEGSRCSLSSGPTAERTHLHWDPCRRDVSSREALVLATPSAAVTPTLPGAPQHQRPRTFVLEIHGNPACPPLLPAGAQVCLPGSSCAPSGLPRTPLAEPAPELASLYGISVLSSLVDSLVAHFLSISPRPIGCPFEDANSILLMCGWGWLRGD